MQNKGFIKVIAGALFLVCSFYLSFTCVTSYYAKQAEKIAKSYAGERAVEGSDEYQMLYSDRHRAYLDSMSTEPVWFSLSWTGLERFKNSGYTLKECYTQEIGLGLDLKGGMNVVLEVSAADILRALSNYSADPTFNKALELAVERQTNSQSNFVTLFETAYRETDPNAKLATVFSSRENKISLSSSNAEIIKYLNDAVRDATDNSFNVLRQRIDRFGVAQPNIQKLEGSGRILVELPGIKEPERVRKLLQGTASLEFWETYELSEIAQQLIAANDMLRELYAGNKSEETDDVEAEEKSEETTAQSKLDSLKLAAAAASQQPESTQQQSQALDEFRKQNPLFGKLNVYFQGGQIMPGPAIGDAFFADTAAINSMLKEKHVRELFPRDLALKWAVKAINEKDQRYQLIAIKVTKRDGRAALEGDVVTDAKADFGQFSSSANVSMSMNNEGAREWARLTKENSPKDGKPGRCIAIVLDDYVYSYPRVQGEIPGGTSSITGNFTVDEAKDLANTLKSGKMPAPARIVQEDIVGPSLGQEAIHAGLISFIIAFILVMLYMIFFYGVASGLVTDIALLVNVFTLFGFLASFKAVLTLPGIAGIVLTMGMAVDANVLIFERIREELAGGKTLKKAIEAGYSNAMSAILDSNITTLLTGIVLFYFGTGPIRGFATTLIIGIITSFLTSVFLTRIIFETVLKNEKGESKNWTFSTPITKNWFKNINFNFLGKRRIGYIISGAIVLISIVSLATRGLSMGIDFSGGRNYVVRFENPVKTAAVKDLLKDAFEGEAVNVITIGSENQVRISTNYGITSQNKDIDAQIENRLYDGLKPLLPTNVSADEFIDNYIVSSQKVGPSIADDIKTSAMIAVLFAIIVIGLYIFIRFRDLMLSAGAVIALVHDVLIILGLYSLFYSIMPFSMEIDQSFIAAILTVVGYTINDKVIIYDRIRENRTLYPKRAQFDTINISLNATLGRTFNTGITTSVVLLAIFIFGGEVIRGFIFALLVGVITGIYSTLFTAAPIAYEMMKKKDKIAEK